VRDAPKESPYAEGYCQIDFRVSLLKNAPCVFLTGEERVLHWLCRLRQEYAFEVRNRSALHTCSISSTFAAEWTQGFGEVATLCNELHCLATERSSSGHRWVGPSLPPQQVRTRSCLTGRRVGAIPFAINKASPFDFRHGCPQHRWEHDPQLRR
jgi:hypothetical protein